MSKEAKPRSVVFLFGAGASFGSGPCIPDPPPLGIALFRVLRAQDGPAARVSAQVAEQFEADFEAGMDLLYEKQPELVSDLLCQMAAYFAQFSPGKLNRYELLATAALASRSKVTFATTNYELLIELAINAAGGQFNYDPRVPNDLPTVLKIHGSCNFLPDGISGIGFVARPSDRGRSRGGMFHAPVRVSTSAQEVIDHCREGTPPAIASYMRGKRVEVCSDFVRAQQSMFYRALESADQVYVVGLRINPEDNHIWEPLHGPEPLGYVGGERQQFETWSADRKGESRYLGATFEEALPELLRGIG